jgi:transmembrane sensor
MTFSKTENIIVKYLTKSATLSELDILTEWIKTSENKEIFKAFVQTHYEINYSIHNPDSEKLIEELLLEIRKNKSIFYKKKFNSILKYAAIFISILGVSYFYLNPRASYNNEGIIVKGEITLEQEDGSINVINSNDSKKIIDKSGKIVGTQNGNSINYKSGDNIDKLAYNILNVPNGKKFKLTLSDGTKVHLNSGSSLKYPVNFIKNNIREIFLLTGEAYLDVSKDKNCPFIVNTKGMNIRVLGTKFNVSSYSEDLEVNTVLVEGLVSIFNKDEVYNESKAQLLQPSHKASFNKATKNISIEKVDTSIYTAWINGHLFFNDETFKSIINKLERYFDIIIINQYQYLDNKLFTAKFKNENINEILDAFIENTPFEYKIMNKNKIIITKPISN